ncbi:MAG: hypothetical protein HC934_10540 [Acaryochloridaceae cyanobacterium SU_2_1]|nr:hypothetical protein [Acaryochloridaceae cyanobacterium SU_2_1]NJM95290.1 hypothetical protein [Acaryochloridaceae cyanobacterium CSU_5_19]
MPKYVMWGYYCDDVLEKRVPYRQAHLEGLQVQKAAGTLLTLGPTQDTKMVFGLYEADHEGIVRQLIESDPYWQHQIWTTYEIREWIQAL